MNRLRRFLFHFFLCGMTGWCLEVVFTSMESILIHDWRLMGRTSLLMFPIYGCAALILPAYGRLKSLPFLLRGFLYTALFYLVEFASGSVLQAFHICPWDYTGARHQYKGMGRLDYLPVWFFTGLFSDKILTKSS